MENSRISAHQIRVHLQYLGHPIANDPLYAQPAVWGESVGKGGVDLVPEEGSLDAEAILAGRNLAQLSLSGSSTPASSSAVTPVHRPMPTDEDRLKGAEALPEGAAVGHKSVGSNRDTENIDLASPIRLSRQAREIISRLRRLKDEAEDWIKCVLPRSFSHPAPAHTQVERNHLQPHRGFRFRFRRNHSRPSRPSSSLGPLAPVARRQAAHSPLPATQPKPQGPRGQIQRHSAENSSSRLLLATAQARAPPARLLPRVLCAPAGRPGSRGLVYLFACAQLYDREAGKVEHAVAQVGGRGMGWGLEGMGGWGWGGVGGECRRQRGPGGQRRRSGGRIGWGWRGSVEAVTECGPSLRI